MVLISVELLIMLCILLFIPRTLAGPCFIGFAIGESLGAAALRVECSAILSSTNTVRSRPSRRRSRRAWYPVITPSSSSARRRRRHGEGDRCRRSASAALVIRPSACRTASMRRSIGSRVEVVSDGAIRGG